VAMDLGIFASYIFVGVDRVCQQRQFGFLEKRVGRGKSGTVPTDAHRAAHGGCWDAVGRAGFDDRIFGACFDVLRCDG
jgi:hypothetical protein